MPLSGALTTVSLFADPAGPPVFRTQTAAAHFTDEANEVLKDKLLFCSQCGSIYWIHSHAWEKRFTCLFSPESLPCWPSWDHMPPEMPRRKATWGISGPKGGLRGSPPGAADSQPPGQLLCPSPVQKERPGLRKPASWEDPGCPPTEGCQPCPRSYSGMRSYSSQALLSSTGPKVQGADAE